VAKEVTARFCIARLSIHIWLSLCQKEYAHISKLIGLLPWKYSGFQNSGHRACPPPMVQGRKGEVEGDKKRMEKKNG
jgi:hypothetical protein